MYKPFTGIHVILINQFEWQFSSRDAGAPQPQPIRGRPLINYNGKPSREPESACSGQVHRVRYMYMYAEPGTTFAMYNANGS